MDTTGFPTLDEEVLEAVNRITQDLLKRKQNPLDDQIIRIATPAEAITIRDLVKPPCKGRKIQDVVDSAQMIFDNRVRMDSPKWFGFIPAPVPTVAWLGELLNSSFNCHAGSWLQSSGVSAIEDSLISFLAGKAGLPASAGGCFVSGGSMANLTGLTLARDQKLQFEQRSRATAYVSDQTHHSVAKGLGILGFHQDQVRKIPSDENFRIDVHELRETITSDREKGMFPFLIVGSCGTTNTGSIDPLEALAELAESENLWLHIDGAYGASVALSNAHSDLVRGLRRADSLAWDAHKWLFQTYGCAMVIAREKLHLVESFASRAEYLADAKEAIDTPNFWNFGPDLTRPSRAMRLWFTLQVLGLQTMGEMIDHGFKLAERAETGIRGLADWNVISRATLGIVTFRYAPGGYTDEELDEMNFAISRKAIAEDFAGILTTKVRGMTVLRICSIHPDLKLEEMDEIIKGLEPIARCVRPIGTSQVAN